MEHSLSDYSFEFPQELIASRTAGKGKTRILHCPRNGGERRILKAPEIVDLFNPGDCLVVNNTKVIPARLYGHTLHGGEVETLLVQSLIPAESGEARYEAQVRPGKAFKVGRELEIAGVKTVVEEVREVMYYLARREAIIIDPCYTGKTFEAIVDGAKNGSIKKGSDVIFMHTGGLPGIYTKHHRAELERELMPYMHTDEF